MSNIWKLVAAALGGVLVGFASATGLFTKAVKNMRWVIAKEVDEDTNEDSEEEVVEEAEEDLDDSEVEETKDDVEG